MPDPPGLFVEEAQLIEPAAVIETWLERSGWALEAPLPSIEAIPA